MLSNALDEVMRHLVRQYGHSDRSKTLTRRARHDPQQILALKLPHTYRTTQLQLPRRIQAAYRMATLEATLHCRMSNYRFIVSTMKTPAMNDLVKQWRVASNAL